MDDVGAEAERERLGHLLAHLVAARPDRRADRRPDAPPSAAAAVPDDPGEEAAPAGVEDGDRRASPSSRTSAIGRQSARGRAAAAPARPSRARRPARRARRGRRGARSSSASGGSASAARGRRRPRAQSRRRFSSTRSGVVVGHPAEVERANGPSLTPPTRVEKTTSYGPAAPSGSRSAPAARPSSRPRSLRVGILDHLVEQGLQRAAELRALGEAEPDQVVAVDARSASRCGCERSVSTARGSARVAGSSRRRRLPRRSASLWSSRSRASASPCSARKPARPHVVGRLGIAERVLAHDPDDVRPQPRRVAQPRQRRRPASSAPISCVGAAVASPSGLPRSCSSAASRTASGAPGRRRPGRPRRGARRAAGVVAAPDGRSRAPARAPAAPARDARVARSRSAFAGGAEQQLRELAHPVSGEPAADPLAGDVPIRGAHSRICAACRRPARGRAARRSGARGRAAAGRRGSSSAPSCGGRVARGPRAVERVDELARLEPARDRVDREVAPAMSSSSEIEASATISKSWRPGPVDRSTRGGANSMPAGAALAPPGRAGAATPTSCPPTSRSSTRPCGSSAARERGWSTPGHDEVLLRGASRAARPGRRLPRGRRRGRASARSRRLWRHAPDFVAAERRVRGSAQHNGLDLDECSGGSCATPTVERAGGVRRRARA